MFARSSERAVAAEEEEEDDDDEEEDDEDEDDDDDDEEEVEDVEEETEEETGDARSLSCVEGDTHSFCGFESVTSFSNVDAHTGIGVSVSSATTSVVDVVGGGVE